MADERRGGAAGLPVRLGDASRCMHGDAERVRRLDNLVRRPRHGVSVRSAIDSLARIPTLVENVQAQGNLTMSAVSEPRDGWTQLTASSRSTTVRRARPCEWRRSRRARYLASLTGLCWTATRLKR